MEPDTKDGVALRDIKKGESIWLTMEEYYKINGKKSLEEINSKYNYDQNL